MTSVCTSEQTPTKRRGAATSERIESVVNDALEKILTRICAHIREKPEKALAALDMVEGDKLLYTKSMGPAAVEKPFHTTLGTVSLIPKDFLKEVLPALRAKKDWDVSVMDSLEKHIKGTIRGIFYYIYSLHKGSKWSKHAKERQILRDLLGSYHLELGLRIDGLEICKTPTNKPYIDWSKQGIWAPHPASATAPFKALWHRFLKKEFTLISDLPSVNIVDNFCEQYAYVTVGRQKLYVTSMLSEVDLASLRSSSCDQRLDFCSKSFQQAMASKDVGGEVGLQALTSEALRRHSAVSPSGSAPSTMAPGSERDALVELDRLRHEAEFGADLEVPEADASAKAAATAPLTEVVPSKAAHTLPPAALQEGVAGGVVGDVNTPTASPTVVPKADPCATPALEGQLSIEVVCWFRPLYTPPGCHWGSLISLGFHRLCWSFQNSDQTSIPKCRF